MKSLVDIAQVAGPVIATLAFVISLLAWRDANSKAADIDAGMHCIAYRDHIWSLHNSGMTIEEIEAVLRRETYRPGVPLIEANAYDNGYALAVGSVREVLDPLGHRDLPASPDRRELGRT